MKRSAYVSESRNKLNTKILFVFLWDRLMKMNVKVKMLLNPVRRPRLFMSTVIQPPTVPGASPSTLLSSDSGSNQKPHCLWPNTHPPDHVGNRKSCQMCVYIPQNVPKPQRNRNLKNQNIEPSRVRSLVSGVIDSDARHLNR